MTLRYFLFLAFFTTLIRAETVIPPVARTLTDEFERTIEARIVGVTSDSVEIIRSADQARFTLSLKKLSASDRDFAAALLRKITESRPLPDTPLITAIRRDFQVFDSSKKRLVSVDSNAFASARILVVGLQFLHDPTHVFASSTNARDPVPDQAPVLWVFYSGEPALFELAGEKLPAGHTMISYKAQEAALSQGREAHNDYMSAWFKRKRPDPFSGESISFKPSDKERSDLIGKLRKAMPPYWTDYRANFDFGETGSLSYPRFVALRRDGSPVKFRGSDLSGSFKVVMTVLRDNAAELE